MERMKFFLMGWAKVVNRKTLCLLLLMVVIGCGQGKKSASQLYEEAKALQKEAETCFEKRDFNGASIKYHQAIERATESLKSDWDLPNYVARDCKKGIELVEKNANEQGLVYYEGRYIPIEEKENILKKLKEKEEAERRKQEEFARIQNEQQKQTDKMEWERNKNDVKTILKERSSEFYHYLIAKDFEKAKEYIELRGREKWFKKMKERDILTDILTGNSLPKIERIDFYESDRVAVVTTTMKLPASSGGSDLTGGENWIFLDSQWYKSSMDILPLRAIAVPNKISSEVNKQIQTLEQLIYQSQDEAEKYFEESQNFGEIVKQSQEKFMDLAKESHPDISLLKEEMTKQDYYLKESKRYMNLAIEIFGKQKEYANQLLKLKR